MKGKTPHIYMYINFAHLFDIIITAILIRVRFCYVSLKLLELFLRN